MNEEMFANYLGPKAENIEMLKNLVNKVLDHQAHWRQSFYSNDKSLYENVPAQNSRLEIELEAFLKRSDKSFPYFHPRYAAQMVKDPSFPTILGYLAFMLSNPNNHAYEGGPVTTEMEMEAVELMLKFTGLNEGWGHLCSGGSLANMEALWAARDFYSEGKVCFSEVSHYSWKRICKILGIKNYKEMPVDQFFRMDINSLEEELKKNKVMFVMANLGSTGAGSVDNLEELLLLREKYNFHLHVDAAYGGFVKSVILNDDYTLMPFNSERMHLSAYTYKQLSLLGEADSITIDPHKHGLISYGAGAVLYKNEELRSVLLNTAPYTYHKQDKPNIGMFSLEGSRPGAMAAACYLTYKVMPPVSSSIGSLISQSLAASKKLHDMIEQSPTLANLNYPDLDINCFYRQSPEKNVAKLNEQTLEIYHRLSVETENPEFIISKFVIPPHIARTALPGYSNMNGENLTALRTVFMKHWPALNDFYYVKELMRVLE